MRRTFLALALILISVVLPTSAAGPSAWKPGDGIQVAFSPDAWPELLGALKSVDLTEKPYFYKGKWTVIEGWWRMEVLTPFSRAAKIAQERFRGGQTVGYEDVREALESGVLIVRLRGASAEGFKIRLVMELGGGQTKVHPVKEIDVFDETASQGGYTVKTVETTFSLEDIRKGQERLQFKGYKDAFVVQFLGNIKPERCGLNLAELR